MRPPFEEIQSGAEFMKWYWLKEELVAACAKLGLPKNGSKFELRNRLTHYLETGEVLALKSPKKDSTFNWAKEELTLDTIITDNVSFGPNFRGFMKEQLGSRFSCTSEFMDWVKANTGKRLREAVAYWKWLEGRKQDPTFKRKIASHNMYSQYIRDYVEANPGTSLSDAKVEWMKDKQKPNEDGFVKYEKKQFDE